MRIRNGLPILLAAAIVVSFTPVPGHCSWFGKPESKLVEYKGVTYKIDCQTGKVIKFKKDNKWIVPKNDFEFILLQHDLNRFIGINETIKDLSQ